MPDPFLEVNVEASRAALAAIDAPQLLYLLVEVRPAGLEEYRRTPLNLSLVVDRSTSMRGQRLASVRAAATMIVENLSPEDSLSVIAFSDRASVIVPADPLKDEAQVIHKIRQIEAFGGTEAFQGLEAGYKELRRVPLAEHTNHLILLTDGHTYGDAEACLGLVRSGAEDGINLSAFGIGSEWNERFLDQLAAISGGETSYIASAGDVVHALQQCIQGLGRLYADNVRLARDFPSTLKLESAFRVMPSAQPLGTNGSELRLGKVEGRSPLTFLMEFTVAPRPAGTTLPLVIDLTADIPSESTRNYQMQVKHDLAFVADEPEGEPSETLLAAVQAWNLHKMNDNVWSDIERGEVQRAKTRMQHLTMRLAEAGQTKLAEQLRTETARLSTGDISPEGRKMLTYATRALVSQTVALRKIDDETVP